MKSNPQVYTTQEGMQEIKNSPQVYTTQEGMLQIKNNPQVYTTQEGTKNWIHTNFYQDIALCLQSFFEASTVNVYNYYPLLVPECRCQARLFLTDIFAISHDFSTGGISRLKCTVESDLIYRINNRIIFWNSPCLISPVQRAIEDITYMLFGYLALNEQPLLARLRPAGGTERIVVIAESTKQFVLCKSIQPDFTLTF